MTIIGPGRVGESTAQIIAKTELCRALVLLGRQAGKAKGIALDIQESAPLFRFDTRVSGGADPAAMVDSDLVIFTAGLPRKPGMSRSDLVDANLAVLREAVDNVMRYAPNALLLIVTNPVDVLTYHAWRQTGWGRHRVLGLSGVLDSARMASFIAHESGFSVKDIATLVIGGHGDAMVPLTRYAGINGIPISQFLDTATIDRVIEKTRKGGAEILALKESSSAYDSPAASVAAMVDAMARNRRRILPCVAILDGEYGERDIAMGVPIVLAGNGVERVIELPLTPGESVALARSIAQLRETLGQ
ncbi:Malate dehydrogenase [hydrothermal vent metagenome]|uniref:Malate dehydrogenase n=1 Tax=hydrothermal vent metagenome TaxID=652676 RepID=A0A3B1ABI2_9ZZZZ